MTELEHPKVVAMRMIKALWMVATPNLEKQIQELGELVSREWKVERDHTNSSKGLDK